MSARRNEIFAGINMDGQHLRVTQGEGVRFSVKLSTPKAKSIVNIPESLRSRLLVVGICVCDWIELAMCRTHRSCCVRRGQFAQHPAPADRFFLTKRHTVKLMMMIVQFSWS